jgi:hypothetical protein
MASQLVLRQLAVDDAGTRRRRNETESSGQKDLFQAHSNIRMHAFDE